MKKKTGKQTNRFVAPLERSDNKLWGSHVRVPARIAGELASGRSRRIICTLNDAEPFQCALLPFGSGQFVISVNKTLRTKLGIEIGDDLSVTVRKDDSTYGLPVPEELMELFTQDKEGDRLFHALTGGKQRTLLYMIGSAKDPDKRIHRALVIMRHLKENLGKINYRQLYHSLRDPRRRSLRASR
jgi:bifunctional DNA-binding transcriptional regulator/antitoxin component of YhaV-PrlF toxin-antitoxin module